MNDYVLNEHNKEEYPPMHTAEHIVNGEMARRYGCGRAFSAHVERKKTKLDYHLPKPLTPSEIESLQEYVNAVIKSDTLVTEEFISKADAAEKFDVTRLPENASDYVRIIHIGDYDECLCAGRHVTSTAQIGEFRISSYRWENGSQRLVFKLNEPK